MSQLARIFGSMLVASCAVTLTLIAFAHIASAQTTSSTDGNTPLGLSPGAAAGSYPLSDLDQIGLFNGGLNFKLPIMHIGGRGAAGYTMMLQPGQQSLKWLVHHQVWQSCGQNGCIVTGHSYYPTQNWWTPVQPGYSPGVVVGRKAGENPSYPPGCPIGTNLFYTSLTRITFVSADGTEYELRDQRLGGQPQNRSTVCGSQGALRGKVFVSGNGSSVTFISDTDVYDSLDSYPTTFYPSGYLLFPDGTRYRIDSGAVSWIRDRNGNQVTLAGGTQVTTITDSLQRSVNISYGNPDVISFKGYGGAARTIQISRASLSTVLRPCRSDPGYQCFSPQTYKQLFPDLDGSSVSTFDPSVISAVTLPDGRQYRFYYNSYGELARVDLPTGGTIEYDYASGNPLASAGVISGYYPADPYTEKAIYRRVVERRVYPDSNTLEGKTTYSVEFNPTVVDHLTPTGQLLGREKHYFYGSPSDTFFTGANSYPSYTDGREYKTELLDSDGSTVLRRVENDWQQGCAVSLWSNTVPNNPHNADTTSTLEPAGANQVSKQTFNYDCYNNPTDTYEYDYGTGSPATSFTRHTHTDYLTTNPVNGAAYDVLNPNATSPDINATFHIRSLPVQQSVYDAGGVERARTSYEYDNYASDTNHAVLQTRSSISGLCTIIISPTQCDNSNPPGFVQRGNATATTRYLLVNGSVTGSVSAYAQFDVAGNGVKAIDARGSATTLEYDDRFGAPDGDARSNSAPSDLAGLTSYAFATKVTNALGQVSYGQFDYYLGRPVDGEDVNGIVASGYYADALDRPTQVIRGSNFSTPDSQTSFVYDDANKTITSTSDRDSYNDTSHPLKGQILYDGLGRTTESRHYEDSNHYIALQTQYDALGRAYKVSNPFRPLAPDNETAVWTTSAFDALGRVTSITSPDSAVVTTSFNGNTVTATDQASKARKSVTDALGRLTTVYEDPSSLNYSTNYTYDVLNSLTQVSQGSQQTRTFAYDSLKRLTSVTNPENGMVTYTYDNNGNLLTRTDALSITTTIAYDALNRPTSRSYNDSPQTRTVNYYYDSQTLPSGAPSYTHGYSTGRLVACIYGNGSAGTYRGYDAMGRVVRQYQQTDSLNYLVEAAYAPWGMTSETYPSVPGASDRRTVTYTPDGAGRLSALSSSATSYAPAASVSSIGYASHNALNTETYGNNLVHAIGYNNRLQANEVKLGTSGNPTSVIDLVYNYGTTNNNGNVQSMTYAGGGLSYTQSYSYDSLNRLQTAQENSGSSWSQTNGYDLYGNRWIDYGGGNHNLSFSSSTNRITTSGFNYDSNGNLINDTLHTYAFDAENKILKVDSTTAYAYDGEGHRVRKYVGENTRFVYGIGGQLIMEFDGSSGNLEKEYVYGGATLITVEPAVVDSNGTQYTTSDNLGSPRMVTNSSASVVSRHDYLPFGEELFAGMGGRTTAQGYGASDGVRQHFTQKERDNETGLDYFGARYYGSTQGRFTGVDPLLSTGDVANPQSWNRYAYTYNNPLNMVDIAGLWTWGDGVNDDFKKQFRGWLSDVTKARDSFKQGSKEYNKLNGVLKAYGNDPDALAKGAKPDGPSIRLADKGPDGTPIGSDGAHAGAQFHDGRLVSTSVTFNPSSVARGTVDAFIAAHEGTHLMDFQRMADSVKNGVAGFTPTDFEAESNAVETEQMMAMGLQANRSTLIASGDKDDAGQPVYMEHYLYKTSWGAADEATLRNVRNVYLKADRNLSPENPGPKSSPFDKSVRSKP